MTCKMNLDLYYAGGAHIEKEISYMGADMVEIAKDIDRDTNALIDYMRTDDDEGCPVFCFGGFCFMKKGLIAASLLEFDF